MWEHAPNLLVCEQEGGKVMSFTTRETGALDRPPSHSAPHAQEKEPEQ